MRATCPAHLILLDLVTLIISSLNSHLHLPAHSSLVRPNILLSTFFSNTHDLCSFLIVKDKLSQSYKTTYKIIVSYTPKHHNLYISR